MSNRSTHSKRFKLSANFGNTSEIKGNARYCNKKIIPYKVSYQLQILVLIDRWSDVVHIHKSKTLKMRKHIFHIDTN